MTKPLVTLDEVRSYMAIRQDVDMPDVDLRINSQIMLATMQLETALDCEFDYKVRTQFFNPSKAARFKYDLQGSNWSEYGVRAAPMAQTFLLKAFPVDMTQPFQVWYDPLYAFDDQKLLDTGDGSFFVESERARLTLKIMTWPHEQSIKVTYTGGYAVDSVSGTLTTSAPQDLKMACIVQTIYLFMRLQPDNIGMQQDRSQGKIGQGTFMTRGGITPEAATLLWRYKRMAMGKY